MRHSRRLLIGVACLALSLGPVPADRPSPKALEDAPDILREQLIAPTFDPGPWAKSWGRTSVEEWRERIDAIWGNGLPTGAKLTVFDLFWDKLDDDFACFQDLIVDWDGLRKRYRTEIEAGVSRGRFAAIVNHLALALRESHTQLNDPLVNFNTYPAPGVPLMYLGGWGYDAHFGACLTPLDDQTLLVYDVPPGHPLGLEPGDRVLGYDGVPWKDLYPELLETELPLKGFWGSSARSFEHSLQMSAGLNWHLFDTIDVFKHSTGETVHLQLPDELIASPQQEIFCSEQLAISGITKPDMARQNLVTWGLVDGKVGYIYVYGWFWEAEAEFLEAVQTLMFEHETIGLIIDFRLNFGGNMFLSNPALRLLFNEPVSTIGFAIRGDPDDHFHMIPAPDAPPSSYVIHGDPQTFYDRPIAVLTGPGAVSSGDQVALRMAFHPRARTFGKSTATAFNAPEFLLPVSGYNIRYAKYDAYLVSDPLNYLTHDEFHVDRPMWLEPDDVAHGVDSVVAEALRWIRIQALIPRSEPRELMLRSDRR